MSYFGWSWNILRKMGCICTRESIDINNTKYYIRDIIDGGYVI